MAGRGSAEVAANQLHKAAHYARRATGRPDAVLLRAEMVSLFPGQDVTVDAAAFEAAAEAALAGGDAGAGGAGAGRGELLPGRAVRGLGLPAAAAGRPAPPGAAARPAVGGPSWSRSTRPTSRRTSASAQDLLARGDRAGALRQLDRLEQVLRDELGIGPSPEAYDLRVRALDTPVAAPARPRRRGTPAWPGRPSTSAGRRTACAWRTRPAARVRRW